ncbi:MAG: IS110 family transposase [Actinomycetota bacterium]|nr:IS110 family transposase [Actinomycetota bacterium]
MAGSNGSAASRDAGGVVLGVDTHEDEHVAVALDPLGRRLRSAAFPATKAGYRRLLRWGEALGGGAPVSAVGVEGTGSFGAGLARHLLSEGVRVLEVNRPNRQHRRAFGKSDPTDAEAAARAVLAGTAKGLSKGADGKVEMIRALRVARRSAMKARTQAANQLKALRVTAPDGLRDRLRVLRLADLVRMASRFRPAEDLEDPTEATRFAMRSVARRHRALSEEIAELDRRLGKLVAEAAPSLVALKCVSTETASALLIAAGDNPERMRSEAAFASLCGAAPVPASSGKVRRHRLSRGGDRQAKWALYWIAVGRMAWDERTKEYVARRTSEGKSKKEIIRCLKRFVAREVYRVLVDRPSPVLPVPVPALDEP